MFNLVSIAIIVNYILILLHLLVYATGLIYMNDGMNSMHIAGRTNSCFKILQGLRLYA
jgi:hypothetical protein